MAYLDLGLPRSPRRHRICVPGTLILSFVFFGSTQARSQDVAEAARQERAKKDSQEKKSKHVYTNDDLNHPVILTPEDRDQLQAKKNQDTFPVEKPADTSADSTDAQNAPEQIPLGDVARANRKQKLLRQRLQPQQSAQYRLPVASAPLAAPKPPVFPGAKPPSNSLVITLPTQRPSADLQPFVHPRKRSPFDRTLVPVSPALRPSLKAPALPTLNSNLRPVAPVTPAAPAVIPSPTFKALPVPPIVSGPPKPSAPAVRIVVVRPGDSLWRLAEQNLGRGLGWHELVAANPRLSNPNHIAVGSTIVVPASLPAVRHSSSTTSRIKVLKGDTLGSIAHTHLGHASAWACIARVNPLLHDPNRIRAGQQLLLPSSCSASSR